jgi:hypothetical protein
MNIVHPGDHIFLAVPAYSEKVEGLDPLEVRIGRMGADLPEGIMLTWVPIGPRDSEPSVLFVIRQQ